MQSVGGKVNGGGEEEHGAGVSHLDPAVSKLSLVCLLRAESRFHDKFRVLSNHLLLVGSGEGVIHNG